MPKTPADSVFRPIPSSPGSSRRSLAAPGAAAQAPGPPRGRRWRESVAALAVVSALAAMAFHAGTFHRGATALSLAVGAALLLALAFAGRESFLDPLALGRRGSPRRWWWPALLGAFWFAVFLSWLQSPVGRAGEAIVLFLLPAAWAAAGIGRLLGSGTAARWALAGCALVAVFASTWALALQPLHEQGRAALPIGHHNQLALVLVALLPAAVLGAWRVAGPNGRRQGAAPQPLAGPGGSRAVGPGRRRLRQGAALFAGAVLVWTLAATGSMSGLAALLVQAAAAAAWMVWRSRGRRLLRPPLGAPAPPPASEGGSPLGAPAPPPASEGSSPLGAPASPPAAAAGGQEDRAAERRPNWAAALVALLALAAGLALATAWAGSRLDVPGPIGRLGAVLRLEDPSLLARRTYAEAAASGFGERPLLGWGPGSTSWTLANHWRPAPGVHPPGEVVTDAHSLLAQAPYELGVAGSLLLLAVAVRYGQRRLSELVRPPPAPAGEGEGAAGTDRALLAAAMLGLLGAGVCLAFGVFAVVTAVPAVVILNLGLASAARRVREPAARPAPASEEGSTLGAPASPPASEENAAAKRRPSLRWRRALQIAFHLWLVAALVWTWQRTSATRSYERVVAMETGLREVVGDGEAAAGAGETPAVSGESAPAAAGSSVAARTADLLAAAAARDPSFPLYRARLDPWAAAEAADGLAPLWLLAGVDRDLDVERRRLALERACDLDPLSALAPFELMRLEREAGAAATDPSVAARAARAILAEPLLLAASTFEGDPDLRSEIHRRIRSWPGLPPGWLAAFEELWFGLDWSNGREGPPRDVLSVDADGRPAVSFSLFAFRRPPWPFSIGAVPLRSHRLDFVAAHDLPGVTRLPQTAPEPFWFRHCGAE